MKSYNCEMVLKLINDISELDFIGIVDKNKQSPTFSFGDLTVNNIFSSDNVVALNKKLINLTVIWEEKSICSFVLDNDDFEADPMIINEFIKENLINSMKTCYFDNWYFRSLAPMFQNGITIERTMEIVNNRMMEFGIVTNLLYDRTSMILSAYNDKTNKIIFNHSLTNNTSLKRTSTVNSCIRLMTYDIFFDLFYEHNGMNTWYEPK